MSLYIFTNEQTEAQRGEATGPQQDGQRQAELGLERRPSSGNTAPLHLPKWKHGGKHQGTQTKKLGAGARG